MERQWYRKQTVLLVVSWPAKMNDFIESMAVFLKSVLMALCEDGDGDAGNALPGDERLSWIENSSIACLYQCQLIKAKLIQSASPRK